MGTTNPDIHKPGTDDGWHGRIARGSQFPPELDRYHLYIGTPRQHDSTPQAPAR